jgi:DNA end-binding protein Ku
MAARAIWTGIVTFGMVSIPVKLYSATENKDISFNQLHGACKSRIKEQRFCPTCDRKIEYEEIEKGYEYAKGNYVIISKDDLEKLPLPNKNTVEITSFVKIGDIDPIHYDKSYYLEPEEAAKKPFALFMQAIEQKGMIAIAKVALRSKERLCCLRPMNGTLILNTLLYPEEIRVDKQKPASDVQVSDKELAMAGSLIDLMTDDFHPDNYKDNYREALMKVIEAKLEGKEIVEAPAAPEGKVVDLMEALKASMESMKARKQASTNEPVAEQKEPVAASAERKTKKRATG